MKRNLLLILILLGCLASCHAAVAQSRTNRIYRPCPASTVPASVAIDVLGNITITPCTSRTLTAPGIPLTSYLTADVPYLATDALAATGLTVSVPAAGRYEIDLALQVTASALGGSKFDLGGTATVANFIGQWRSTAVDGTTTEGSRSTAAGTDYTPVTTGDILVELKGSVEFTTGGTFTVRGAQSTSDGFPMTVLRGSTLKLTKF